MVKLPKGYIKISISRKTDARLKAVKMDMQNREPDKFDDDTSRHRIIEYLIDEHIAAIRQKNT